MAIYVNGIGNVSPQKTWNPGSFLDEVREYDSRMIQCLEPDVDPGLNDKYLRRMSRLIRLGWTAAKICMDDAGGSLPDAIITGSGWGSVGDSEKFLLSIYRNKENLLPPTPFIQSTHNALGAQIALLISSYAYNMSYAHASFAFEHALLDSIMRFRNRESNNILCGGFDEITPNQFILMDRLKRWREHPVSNLKLLEEKSQGTISGEGFNFFLLQDEKSKKTYAELKDVLTLFSVNEAENFDIISPARAWLEGKEIDWVFAGLNGDRDNDAVYRDSIPGLFPDRVNVAAWKHLSGEYLTSSAFAMWAAVKAIQLQRVPDILKIEVNKDREKIKNILVYNHFKGNLHSFILLSHPD